MLFLSFGSGNTFSKDPCVSPDVVEEVDDSSALCATRYQLLQGREKVSKLSYSILRRLWQLGRNFESHQNTNQSPLERRTSCPVEMFEMTSLVGDESESSCPQRRRTSSISFWFWKNEPDEEEYLVASRDVDISSAPDIDRLSELMRARIKEKKCSATAIAEMFQNIYRKIDKELRKKVVFSHLTPEKKDSLMVSFEHHLLKKFHEEIFAKISAEEEKHDRVLSSRIESFCWVTLKNLEAKVDETDLATWRYLDQAMLDIAAINFKESVVDKLRCIMRCSRRIFDALKISNKGGGADTFLPLMIYVVLQANPGQLHSNIRYILQFANTDRVMKGEEGYYFTHLCSVVSYIENLNAKTLGMLEDDFKKRLNSQLVRNGGIDKRRMANIICKVYRQAAEEQALYKKQQSLRQRCIGIQQKLNVVKEELDHRRTERRSSFETVKNYVFDSHGKGSLCSQCRKRSWIV